VVKGAANPLTNRRMNKAQQMRWSRQRTDLLLQIRSAIHDRFEPETGRTGEPLFSNAPQLALAA
jgi:hypothetical protein